LTSTLPLAARPNTNHFSILFRSSIGLLNFTNNYFSFLFSFLACSFVAVWLVVETCKIIIALIDVNDELPLFYRNISKPLPNCSLTKNSKCTFSMLL